MKLRPWRGRSVEPRDLAQPHIRRPTKHARYRMPALPECRQLPMRASHGQQINGLHRAAAPARRLDRAVTGPQPGDWRQGKRDSR